MYRKVMGTLGEDVTLHILRPTRLANAGIDVQESAASLVTMSDKFERAYRHNHQSLQQMRSETVREKHQGSLKALFSWSE